MRSAQGAKNVRAGGGFVSQDRLFERGAEMGCGLLQPSSAAASSAAYLVNDGRIALERPRTNSLKKAARGPSQGRMPQAVESQLSAALVLKGRSAVWRRS